MTPLAIARTIPHIADLPTVLAAASAWRLVHTDDDRALVVNSGLRPVADATRIVRSSPGLFEQHADPDCRYTFLRATTAATRSLGVAA